MSRVVEGDGMPENKQAVCRTNSYLSNLTYRKIKRVLSFKRRIFGQRLEETMVYERRYGEHLVPLIVQQCVAFIRDKGLLEVGLFRQPGQATLVKELQVAFDAGEKPTFDNGTDVHTVASLLKLYLRELPEPVVPFSCYHNFLLCGKRVPSDRQEALKELRRLLRELPMANFNLLRYICGFLQEVQSHSNINKMSTQNLATVFGPNIMRPKAEDPESIIGGAALVQQLMSELIRESHSLFRTDISGSDYQPPRDQESHREELSRRPSTHLCSRQISFPGKEPAPPSEEAPLSRCRSEMAHQIPLHETPSSRSHSDPLYDNYHLSHSEMEAPPPTAATAPLPPVSSPIFFHTSWEESLPFTLLPGRWGGRCRTSQSFLTEQEAPRSSNESTLSVYDNISLPNLKDTPNSLHPCVLEETATFMDRTRWTSCKIALDETGAGSSHFTPDEHCKDPPVQLDIGEEAMSKTYRESIPHPVTSLQFHPESSSVGGILASFKQEMAQQKEKYEVQIKSLEERNETLQGEVSSLRANLEQQRRWHAMAEMRRRDAERALVDADRRNAALQQEMEQFFDAFGELNGEARKAERIVQSF